MLDQPSFRSINRLHTKHIKLLTTSILNSFQRRIQVANEFAIAPGGNFHHPIQGLQPSQAKEPFEPNENTQFSREDHEV